MSGQVWCGRTALVCLELGLHAYQTPLGQCVTEILSLDLVKVKT